MRPSYSFKLRTTSFILAIVFVVSIFCADLFRIIENTLILKYSIILWKFKRLE